MQDSDRNSLKAEVLHCGLVLVKAHKACFSVQGMWDELRILILQGLHCYEQILLLIFQDE